MAAALVGCSGSSSSSSSGSSGGSTAGTTAGTGSTAGSTGSSSTGTSASTSGSGGSSGSCSPIPSTGSSGGSGGNGGSCQNANGTQCSSLAFTACAVHEVQVAQDAPTPSGGTPVDGTYAVTSVTDYLGTGGTPAETNSYRQGELTFSGNTVTIHELNATVNGPSCEDSQIGTVAFSGSTVTLTPSCPTGGNNGGTASYSATSTTFVLFDPPNGNRTYTRGTTYTKQ